jgi:cell division protein FtsB
MEETLWESMAWLTPLSLLAGGLIAAALMRFFDKANWREVAESRGAENEDLRHKIEDLEARVVQLEAQYQGLASLKSEQIAHLVLEGLEAHRGD